MFCLQTTNLHLTKYTLFCLIKFHCIKLSCSLFLFATLLFTLQGKIATTLVYLVGSASGNYMLWMFSWFFKYHWSKQCSWSFLHAVLYCVVHFLYHINHSANIRHVLSLVGWPTVFKYEKRFYEGEMWSSWYEN